MKKRNKIIVSVLCILMVSLLAITGITVLKRHQRATAVTADVSWYDEEGKEFTITTAEQLYGLAELSKNHDFKGQTIKLGVDIMVNEGNAEDWVQEVPEKLWLPITGFAGKFDGQGHTISGIYGDSIITSLGLFTDTQKTCVIKDLKLVNSCFKNNNERGTGSIIGIGGGKLENIYSDAVLVSAGKYVGGLIGRVVEKGENQITNCWFDGTITMKGAGASEVGGLVGAYTVEDAINAIQHCLSTAKIECMGKQIGGICGNLGSNSFLNLIDTMYTGTLTYDTNYYDVVGSAIGKITDGSSAIIKDTYTVDEIANRTIGTTSGYQEGSAIAIGATELIGTGGYQWTTLDFENYWAVQADDTPILLYFAEKSESIAGLDRLVDISWYNPTGLTFEIKNAKQFYGFAYLSRSYDFSGQTIKLGADITINEGNAEDWQKEAPKNKWTPIAWHGTSLSKRFKGNFDGQGHTISGIYVKGEADDGYIGLFGEIYHGSVVKNFKIVNSYFEGTMESSARGTVGSVCGRLRGTIDSVYSSAIIVNSAKMTGGIAGMINGTGQNTISNCWFDGSVTGVSRTGGILGGVYGNKANIEATIEHCLNTGDIAVKLGKGDVGGMCGIAETWCTLYIKDCLNTGTFATVGEGAKANTHIGTIFGSVTEKDGVGSKVIISNSYGVKEFYSRLVGWKFGEEGIEQSSVAFVGADEVKGYGGYQWTTLDFKNSWAVRKDDVPVPVVFATNRPSVSGIARMVDYSWYDAKSDVMTIKTYQQLYAMARLWDVTNLFKGKTIKLGADIIVNKGNAADWAEKAPALVWEPMKFNGTFDGQGHSISGIYVKGGEKDNYVGLFHRIYQNGTVKNLKLVNSYIEGTMASNVRGAVGSIAGRNNGVIDTIYSNAIVVNSARMTGGIVGMITGEGDNLITNSWFDGKVTGVSRTGGILGGVYGNKENIKAGISHCLNTSDIAVQIGYGDVGGLCGMVETGGILNLTDSLNAGTFAETGEGKKSNTHIGTLVGSVTETEDAKSKLIIQHVYGVNEFYSKLIGWSYAENAVTESSVAMPSKAKISGNGGYQWTTLDFTKYWTTRKEDVPVLLAFVNGTSNVAGIDRKIDLSWYDESKDEYIITTPEQLYGFNLLCDEEHDYFADKIVKLGSDIKLNSGAAEAWKKTAPTNVWTPGNFLGTFDGQGHTISGIYVKGDSEDNYIGFFKRIYKGATVKDLKLTNSYFEGTMASNKRGAVGSIAGRNNGTVDTVYSDAIVVNSARMTGGIVGMITGEGENRITNSWFDGNITGVSRTGGILGGIYGNKTNINVTIEHCLNTGVVSVPFGIGDVGGLCGMIETGGTLNLTDSLNAGNFETVGEGEKENTHVGTLIGSVGDPDDAETKVVIQNTFGVEEFYNRLVGWTYDKKVVSQRAVVLTDMETVEGNGGYQWTTLDFDKYWTVRTKDVPVLVSFAEKVPSLTVGRMVDFTWYDENKDDYVITTMEQLYGFNLLCDSVHDYFAGKTIKLGADIALNSGNAENWSKIAPENVWTPVNFKGTFDGQRYTLSGVYVKSDTTYTGFFTNVQSGATVKNVNLENSYIEGTNTSGRCGTGSIAGRNRGIIDSVYSSAIVKNGALMTGGIAGMTDTISETENKIANCWFDGRIYANGSTGGILGGAYKASASLESCLNTGVLSINSDSTVIGGLFGNVQDASSVVISDSLNAGSMEQVGEGTLKQVGTMVGSLGNKGSLTLKNVYGNAEFSEKKLGYHSKGNLIMADDTVSAVRKLENIKAYGAYQWTTLEFEDIDSDKVNWVLRDGDYPTLNIFRDGNLSVADAKKLPNFKWYNPEVTKYVLYTTQELLGFNLLCGNEDTDCFNGKTIEIGTDITVNEEDAFTWSADNAPKNIWQPANFKGIFDGQGYTISGVYVYETIDADETDSVYTGLFRTINSKAVVKNFYLVNSYIEGTGASGKRHAVGSIAGRNHGTISGVFTDSIVKNSALMTGGIVGTSTSENENSIVNCWFDGKIYAIGSAGGIQGGAYSGNALVEHCLNTGTLYIGTEQKASHSAIGGLFGNVQSDSNVTLKDSLNAGFIEKTEMTTLKQKGAIVGALGNSGTLNIGNVYGNSNFANTKLGYHVDGNLTVYDNTGFAVVKLNDIKGYGAYQWMLLDFEDEDGSEGNDKAYWVLRDGELPALDVFADADIDIEATKQVEDYTWYDQDSKVFEYTIDTLQQLFGFNVLCGIDDYDCFSAKKVYLGADIVMNDVTSMDDVVVWENNRPANTWNPTDFKGTFDGNGHKLIGIYTKLTSEARYVGFFKTLHADAEVKNLEIIYSYFEGTYPYNKESNSRAGVGSVAGRNNGIIDSVYSNAFLKHSALMTGGIAGMVSGSEEAKITNCWFDGKINAYGYVGGILGGTYGNANTKTEVTVEHCLNTGDIEASFKALGGLCGYVHNISCLNLYDSLNVGSLIEGKSQIGSVLGALHDNATLNIGNVYGVESFTTKTFGYVNKGTIVLETGKTYGLRTESELKGADAYKWTLLDFEDIDADGPDKKYWVLVKNGFPELATFFREDKTNGREEILVTDAMKNLPSFSWYTEEEGVDTYILSTAEDLRGFNELCNNSNKYFEDKTVTLSANISLNDVTEAQFESWKTTKPQNINSWTPKYFKGTFDGNENTISGIYVKGGESDALIGLFSRVYKVGSVKNLKLEKCYFESNYTGNELHGVGSIAGRTNGLIQNVHSSAVVKNNTTVTGGIVGLIAEASTSETANNISNCRFDGQIIGSGEMGGILGAVRNKANETTTATIEHCLNEGTIKIQSKVENVGGLCGIVNEGTELNVKDSLNAGACLVSENGSITNIGNVVGKVDKDATLKLNDVYGVQEFSTHMIGEGIITDNEINATMAATVSTTFALRTLDDIKGTNAYRWTSLDFANSWVLRDGAVPSPAINGITGITVPEDVTQSPAWNVISEDQDTYTISSAQQLYEFNKIAVDFFTGKTINLGADIIVNNGDANKWKSGDEKPSNAWTAKNLVGTFDGQEHTLSGVYVNSTETYTGLFSTIKNNAKVQNLKLVNSYFNGSGSGTRSGVGSIAGRNSGTISNVYSEAIVENSKEMTGGIVGMISETGQNLISNCWFNGLVYSGTNSCGGILGGSYGKEVTIEHCLNTGKLNISGGKAIGGLCGQAQSSAVITIKDSLNAGTLTRLGTLSQVGSTIGTVGNNGKLKVGNVYGLLASFSDLIGYQKNNVTIEPSTATHTELTSEDYGKLLELDDLFWKVRQGKYPMLKSFYEDVVSGTITERNNE